MALRILLKVCLSDVAGFTTSVAALCVICSVFLSFRVQTLSCWGEICGLIKPILILVCSRTSFMCHVQMQRRYSQLRLYCFDTITRHILCHRMVIVSNNGR